MKSPMIVNADYIPEDEKGNYSELTILQSHGGFYVGTIYRDPNGHAEPGSRDSAYFRTRIEAEKFLAEIEESGDTSRLRKHP